MQDLRAIMRHGVTRKRSTKRLKLSINYRLKAIWIIGQKKAFYRSAPESSCVKKETVDIDILVTSRNGDRKIM